MIKGNRFNKLVAIDPDGYKEYGKNKTKFPCWLFRCDCGNIVTLPINAVKPFMEWYNENYGSAIKDGVE